jgi:hypothetical protein
LLILEHGDATLTSSDTQRVIRDPVSGSPFEFDAAKRILTAPPATADLNMIEPPALPW